MARAAVKAKQAQQAAARPKTPARARRHHKSGGNPTQQLFFERMRRKAKFVYFLLALLFAITFAFLGVGSGSSGLSDLFTNINIFHHSGTSVSSAQKEIQKHPGAAKGYRDLATAYEGKAETASAITALQQYIAINKKDAKALTELAGLQLSQAADYQDQYGNAYQIQQQVSPSTSFLPAGKLGKAIGTNPIEQAQSSIAGQNASNSGPAHVAELRRRGRDLPAAGEAPAEQRERPVPARQHGADRGADHRVADVQPHRGGRLQGVPEAEPGRLDGRAGARADQAAPAGSGEEEVAALAATSSDPSG